jgi:hypothetical protein
MRQRDIRQSPVCLKGRLNALIACIQQRVRARGAAALSHHLGALFITAPISLHGGHHPSPQREEALGEGSTPSSPLVLLYPGDSRDEGCRAE